MPDTRSKSSVRDAIIEAAIDAPQGRIDDLVYLDTDLCTFLLSDRKRLRKVFIDVPVDRVVAVGRFDFLKAGDTWRTAVSGLTFKGWTDAAFDYFEAPLLEENFPAQHSLYELRLAGTGGLCYVTNGNHRLVGGRAWLTAKYGNSAFWKQASVQYEPLTRSAQEMLSRAAEAKTSLRVALLGHPHKFLFVGEEAVQRVAALGCEPSRIFALGQSKATALDAPWHFRLHRNFAWTFWGRLSWCEIPFDLVVRLLDDGWITSQLQACYRREE